MKVLERFRQELQRSIAGMPIQCQSDLSIYLSIYIYIYIFIYLFIYIHKDDQDPETGNFELHYITLKTSFRAFGV